MLLSKNVAKYNAYKTSNPYIYIHFLVLSVYVNSNIHYVIFDISFIIELLCFDVILYYCIIIICSRLVDVLRRYLFDTLLDRDNKTLLGKDNNTETFIRKKKK